MSISLSRLKARYLDASSSKVLFLRYQPPRPALHVSPEYRLVRRSTVLPLCVSAKPSTVGGWGGVLARTGTHLTTHGIFVVIDERVWNP